MQDEVTFGVLLLLPLAGRCPLRFTPTPFSVRIPCTPYLNNRDRRTPSTTTTVGQQEKQAKNGRRITANQSNQITMSVTYHISTAKTTQPTAAQINCKLKQRKPINKSPTPFFLFPALPSSPLPHLVMTVVSEDAQTNPPNLNFIRRGKATGLLAVLQ